MLQALQKIAPGKIRVACWEGFKALMGESEQFFFALSRALQSPYAIGPHLHLVTKNVFDFLIKE